MIKMCSNMTTELLLSSSVTNLSHFVNYFVSLCRDMRVLWGQQEGNSGLGRCFMQLWTCGFRGCLCEDLIIQSIFISWMRKTHLRKVSLDVSSFLAELFLAEKKRKPSQNCLNKVRSRVGFRLHPVKVTFFFPDSSPDNSTHTWTCLSPCAAFLVVAVYSHQRLKCVPPYLNLRVVEICFLKISKRSPEF